MRWAALSEKSTSDTVAPVPLSASTSAVRALRTAPASTDAERSTTMVTVTPHVGESDGLAATEGAGSAHPAGTVTGPSPSTSGVQSGSTDDAGGSLVATVALVSVGALLAGSEATGSVEAAGSVVSTVPVVSAGAEAAGGSVPIGSDGGAGVGRGDRRRRRGGRRWGGHRRRGRDRLGRVDDGQRGGRGDEHRHPDQAGDQPAQVATNLAVLALHVCAPRSVVPCGGSATGHRGHRATAIVAGEF